MFAMLYCTLSVAVVVTQTLAILSPRQNFFPAKSSHGSFNINICNNSYQRYFVQCSTILDNANDTSITTIVILKLNHSFFNVLPHSTRGP